MAKSGDLLIIDCHNHLYPNAEAGRSQKRGVVLDPKDEEGVIIAPGFQTKSYGVIEDAAKNMERGNIAKTFILPLMPIMMMRHKRVSALPGNLGAKERQQAEKGIDELLVGRIQRINRWACGVAKEDPRFVPFGIVDPFMGPDAIRREIRDLIQNHGAKGVGELCADQMGTTVDGTYGNDPSLWPIWEAVIELNVPVLVHFGPSHRHPVTGEPNPRNNPEYYADVLARYPKLKMVMLHMGVTAAYEWPDLYKPTREAGLAFAKSHPNVICDISGNVGYGMPVEDVVQSIREVGAERVIWGSDFMWVDPLEELRLLLGSSLTDREKRMVLGENAVRFFDLKV